MDQLGTYRQIIERVLRDYAAIPSGTSGVETKVIVDRESDDYLLFGMGWNALRRVHSVYAHIRLRDGKVWIEKDGTEKGLAVDFGEAGIPKSDIVLAFYQPEHRKLTDYAVA